LPATAAGFTVPTHVPTKDGPEGIVGVADSLLHAAAAAARSTAIATWGILVVTAARRGARIAGSPGREVVMAKKRRGRELINTGTDTRYVRRDARARFNESDDVGRS